MFEVADRHPSQSNAGFSGSEGKETWKQHQGSKGELEVDILHSSDDSNNRTRSLEDQSRDRVELDENGPPLAYTGLESEARQDEAFTTSHHFASFRSVGQLSLLEWPSPFADRLVPPVLMKIPPRGSLTQSQPASDNEVTAPPAYVVQATATEPFTSQSTDVWTGGGRAEVAVRRFSLAVPSRVVPRNGDPQ
jgi:hypothetical protein